jgi:hypothetical protein
VRFGATFVARGGIEEEQKVLDEFRKRFSGLEFVW